MTHEQRNGIWRPQPPPARRGHWERVGPAHHYVDPDADPNDGAEHEEYPDFPLYTWVPEAE